MNVIRDRIALPLAHLKNHPKNVRKDYGDLTELTESIRQMGLLQNLVVVPAPGYEGSTDYFDMEYYVVAGNRRLLALKEIHGGEEEWDEGSLVLCRVVSLSESEQIAMMLTENINRSRLTPLEEADGFQMMLDLGDTVDDIAKKTGFGKTTVRHRLNIAKIDKDIISQKNEDGWQVSLSDFEKLEKVSPEQRSEVLGKATSPQNLDWQIEAYAREEEKKKNRQLTLESIEAKGIKELPDGASGYATIKTLNYGEECPDVEGEAYWREGYSWFAIVQEISGEEEDKEKDEETEDERRERETEEAKQKIKEILQEADDAQHDFVNMKLLKGNLKPMDTEGAMKILWHAVARTHASADTNKVAGFFTGKKAWEVKEEEREELWQQYLKLPAELQMLVAVSTRITELNGYGGTLNWKGSYNKAAGENMMAAYGALEIFGFSMAEKQEAVMDGASELYAQDEKEG